MKRLQFSSLQSINGFPLKLRFGNFSENESDTHVTSPQVLYVSLLFMTDQTRDEHNSSNNEPASLRSLAQALRCPTSLQQNLCEVCRNTRGRLSRYVTLRGVPRLFLLRRAFCFYWICVVFLLIYLKLYFPLYLTSTVNRSTLEMFQRDWCRMRQARMDWRGVLKRCEDSLMLGQRGRAWGLENRTKASKSYISLVNLRPAGEFSRFSIQSQTYDGRLKTSGGDWWRVYVRGPSALAPSVLDHGNGTYEVLFLVLEAGEYSVDIQLEYSLCDGLRHPAPLWFITGNIHNSNRQNGTLGEKQNYLNRPLGSVIPLTIFIPHAAGPMRSDEFLSSGFGNPAGCGEECKFLWDGYGRWVNGTWKPHVTEMLVPKSPRKREGSLWIFGDSIAAQLHKYIAETALCRRIFKRCNFTSDSVYTLSGRHREKPERDHFDTYSDRFLRSVKKLIQCPEMDDKSVLILNHGPHVMLSTNFTSYQSLVQQMIRLKDGEKELKFKGKLIWKTTTAISRERILQLYHDEGRFLTPQRISLYNGYATWALCKAGIHVLDVHPISESYPGGGGMSSHNTRDPIELESAVFEPVAELLRKHFEAPDYDEAWNVSTK